MKVLLFANTEWYLYNFRLSLAHAIRERGAEVVMVSPPGPYGAKLQEVGFRWLPVPMNRRSLNPWGEARLIGTLARIYRDERPDLAHHFTIKCVVYGSIAARLGGVHACVGAVTGLGHVFTNHTPAMRLLRVPVRELIRYGLGFPRSRLVLQNPDDRDLFLRHRLVSPDHVRIIRGSGVDTFKFSPRPRHSSERFRVLMATRLLWDKGVGEYIEAAKTLRSRPYPIECLLAGDPDEGNPASVPRDYLNEWQREGSVRVMGHVDGMERVLGEVDLVVLPSYREGTPRILLEAAAMGLPIVATDVPGCREVVEDGVNGLLVEPGNAQALAQAIEALAGSPELCSRLGKAGRAKALAEFDERIVIRDTLEVYRELVSIFPRASRLPASTAPMPSLSALP